ncbi:unnamed protein product, partial [Phaeothamnion confervicola]
MTAGEAAPLAVDDTLNKAWKDDTSSFAYRMMLKMGWSKGKGLGVKEDGIATHVRVVKKGDQLGLGAAHDRTGDSDWSATAASFESVLARLGAAYGTGSGGGRGGGSDDGKRKKKKRSGSRK